MQAAVREADGRGSTRTAGGLLQAVWFDAGRPGGRAGCCWSIHHLAVDGVSWRILVPDLAAAWDAVARGEPPQLEPVGTPFRAWARQLAEQAGRRPLLADSPPGRRSSSGGRAADPRRGRSTRRGTRSAAPATCALELPAAADRRRC